MVVALILSGGSGVRTGLGIPKQYVEINDRPVISYCIERLSRHDGIDAIQIAASPEWRGRIGECLEKYDVGAKFRGFSAAGANRQMSVYHGLVDIGRYACASDTVLIHDAARPLLSARMVTECLDALAGHDGVMPVLPVKDTVYRSSDGRKVSALVNRGEIYAGQAPETFRLGPYLGANESLLPDKIFEINGSTEPAVMAGLDVVMIAGDEGNFKITTAADMGRFAEIMEKRRKTGAAHEGMDFTQNR